MGDRNRSYTRRAGDHGKARAHSRMPVDARNPQLELAQSRVTAQDIAKPRVGDDTGLLGTGEITAVQANVLAKWSGIKI